MKTGLLATFLLLVTATAAPPQPALVELLARAKSLELDTPYVPPPGDLLGKQVQVYFAGVPESIEYIRAGKLRALAVTTAARSDALRDIPAMADFVPGYEASGWFGVGAPRNTPVEITDKLNREINGGLADPKLKARFADLGGMVFPRSPTDLGRFISEEIGKWGKVVKFAGIKTD